MIATTISSSMRVKPFWRFFSLFTVVNMFRSP
jgi:hypothetical protein